MSNNQIEQTLDSREVAEMVEKEHNKLLRDIRRYVGQLGEAKIGQSEFFTESTYRNSQNKEMPCYRITKKGCEFIAHKLTGTKGTAFTARYINRFHEMEDIIKGQQAETLPWFIKKFRGRYIILWRDFEKLTGMDLNKRIYGWTGSMIRGRDFSSWAEKDTVDKEEFKQEYGFDYGDDDFMTYFTLSGVRRLIRLFHESGGKVKIDRDVERLLIREIDNIEMKSKERIVDFLWNISNLAHI